MRESLRRGKDCHNVQDGGALFSAYRCGGDWSEVGTTAPAPVEVGPFDVAGCGSVYGCVHCANGRGGTGQMKILSNCFRWAEGGNGKEMADGGNGRI